MISEPADYKGIAVVEGKLSLFVGPVVGDAFLPNAPYSPIVPSHGKGQNHGISDHGSNFAVYTGTPVYEWFPGRVVKVVKNWTPASHNMDGNQIVIRTVEPNGLVFYIQYSHLLGGNQLPYHVGQVFPQNKFLAVGRAGHSGVPADVRTTYSITVWTPQLGGKFLFPSWYAAVSPVTIGNGPPPDFVDTDPNTDGTSDDPDNDSDDPGGFGQSMTGP
jgi:hypothetical protein